jgi:histidyl-tRNA synthetase
MSKEKPSIPKGTRDFSPQVVVKRNYIFSTIRKTFEKFGFQPLETPAMENLSVLTGKYGDEGDQLIFKILNSGDFLGKTTVPDFEQGSKSMLRKISEKLCVTI